MLYISFSSTAKLQRYISGDTVLLFWQKANTFYYQTTLYFHHSCIFRCSILNIRFVLNCILETQFFHDFKNQIIQWKVSNCKRGQIYGENYTLTCHISLYQLRHLIVNQSTSVYILQCKTSSSIRSKSWVIRFNIKRRTWWFINPCYFFLYLKIY